MYPDGWNKYMDNFTCCSSPLNTQMLFYNGYGSHIYYRELDILCRYDIHYFIIKEGGSVYDHPNDKGPNTKLNICHGNARMNWTRHCGALNFTPSHTSYVLVETWEHLKISSATHKWQLTFLRYHEIMVIYHYPFLVVITQLFSGIIFINDYICILTVSPG